MSDEFLEKLAEDTLMRFEDRAPLGKKLQLIYAFEQVAKNAEYVLRRRLKEEEAE